MTAWEEEEAKKRLMMMMMMTQNFLVVFVVVVEAEHVAFALVQNIPRKVANESRSRDEEFFVVWGWRCWFHWKR